MYVIDIIYIVYMNFCNPKILSNKVTEEGP